MSKVNLKAMQNLISNMQDVKRLLSIHKKLTGNKPGRRQGVEILNKSAIVLITACWEAFIEDLATEAFDFLLNKSSTHTDIPAKVRGLIGRSLKKDSDDNSVWKLADSGWRNMLQNHKNDVLKRYTGTLNTPKPDNINPIFEELAHFNLKRNR